MYYKQLKMNLVFKSLLLIIIFYNFQGKLGLTYILLKDTYLIRFAYCNRKTGKQAFL